MWVSQAFCQSHSTSHLDYQFWGSLARYSSLALNFSWSLSSSLALFCLAGHLSSCLCWLPCTTFSPCAIIAHLPPSMREKWPIFQSTLFRSFYKLTSLEISSWLEQSSKQRNCLLVKCKLMLLLFVEYCRVTNFRPVPIFVLLTWNWFVRTTV